MHDHNKHPEPIKVVIAEKNPLLQNSLIQLFAGDGRFASVHMTSDGERFISSLADAHYDVAVIGWEMPYLDGMGVLKALQGQENAPRVIIYTGSANAEIPPMAKALGAAGFCSKSAPPGQLLETVAAVADGRDMFPARAATLKAEGPFEGLTPREKELMAALGDGATNAQIAAELGISLNTVKFHLKNLYEKLDVSNRAQAVAIYLKAQE
jgi:two-component system nitrate/nitrite response regulator NarP